MDAAPIKKQGFPASDPGLPQDNLKFCLGPSGPGPKRRRTEMEELRAWANEWPAKEPIPSTLELEYLDVRHEPQLFSSYKLGSVHQPH